MLNDNFIFYLNYNVYSNVVNSVLLLFHEVFPFFNVKVFEYLSAMPRYIFLKYLFTTTTSDYSFIDRTFYKPTFMCFNEKSCSSNIFKSNNFEKINKKHDKITSG